MRNLRLPWPPSTRDVAVLLALLASLGFAAAIQHALGHYDPPRLVILILAWLAAIVAAALAGRATLRWRAVIYATALAAAAFELFLLVTKDPALFLRPSPPRAWFNTALVAFGVALALIAVGLVRDKKWIVWARRGLLAAAFLVASFWVLAASPEPLIDVWHLNQEASHRLLHGQNPYELRIPHAVPEETPPWIDDHYPYPPIVILLQAPAYLVTGDTRAAHPLAILGFAAALVALARRSGVPDAGADALAAMALLSPRVFFIIEQGWTEPLTAGLLGLACWALAGRRWWTATILLGLALSSKQYVAIGFPILALASWYGWRRALVSAGVAAAVALPFFLWHAERFLWGTILKHLEGDPRHDANSVTAVFIREGTPPPTWIGPVLWVLLGLGLAWWRRKDLAAPWLALGAGLGGLFLFGGQAFANYYWLGAAVFALGAAWALASSPEALGEEPRPGIRVSRPTRDKSVTRESSRSLTNS